MSVVPVREAIRQLEAEGLVTFERNVGAQVAMVEDSEYLHTHADARRSSRAPRPRSPAPHLTPTTSARARDDQRADDRDARPLRPAPLHRAQPRVPRRALRGVPEPAHARPRAPRAGTACGMLRDSIFSFVPGRARGVGAPSTRASSSSSRPGADPLEIELAARRHRTATLDALPTRRSTSHRRRMPPPATPTAGTAADGSALTTTTDTTART